MELRNALSLARADARYVQRTAEVACLAGDTVGSCLCIRGDRVNGKWRVQAADPRDRTRMPAVGILISKSTPTVGIMQFLGPYDLAGLYPGTRYFVGVDAQPAVFPPTALPYAYALIQVIGVAVAADKLLIDGSSGMIMKRGATG